MTLWHRSYEHDLLMVLIASFMRQDCEVRESGRNGEGRGRGPRAMVTAVAYALWKSSGPASMCCVTWEQLIWRRMNYPQAGGARGRRREGKPLINSKHYSIFSAICATWIRGLYGGLVALAILTLLELEICCRLHRWWMEAVWSYILKNIPF